MIRSTLNLFLVPLLMTASLALGQTVEAGTPKEVDSVFEPTKRAIFLLDSGEAGTAWTEGAKVLQDKTPKPGFISGFKVMRGAAGEIKSRTFKGVGFLNDMPEGPRGRYAAVFFDTVFARVDAEEKLVFYNESGRWRLAGYFLSKRAYSGGKQSSK
jgi:hypothetical protein